MKELSCGIIIRIKGQDKLLACHTTGRKLEPGNWDIPKGHIEENDASYAHAACRELYEETGIEISPRDPRLKDHGRFNYNPTKDLYIFSIELNEEDVWLPSLECSTTFIDRWGRKRPEVDSFCFTDITKTDLYFKRLKPIVDKCLTQM